MRVIVAVFILALAVLSPSAANPEPASACSGRQLDLKDALRMSHGAVYAGRITKADHVGIAHIAVTIDVELIVRGPAVSRLNRVEAGDICDGINVGQWGYIVRAVRDPVHTAAAKDLFFRVGRYYGRNAVRAGLLDTATAPGGRDDGPADVPWGWLAVSSAAGFAVAYRRLRNGPNRVRTE